MLSTVASVSCLNKQRIFLKVFPRLNIPTQRTNQGVKVVFLQCISSVQFGKGSFKVDHIAARNGFCIYIAAQSSVIALFERKNRWQEHITTHTVYLDYVELVVKVSA